MAMLWISASHDTMCAAMIAVVEMSRCVQRLTEEQRVVLGGAVSADAQRWRRMETVGEQWILSASKEYRDNHDYPTHSLPPSSAAVR